MKKTALMLIGIKIYWRLPERVIQHVMPVVTLHPNPSKLDFFSLS